MFTQSMQKFGIMSKKLLKLKFNTDPIRDERYIATKLKIINEVNKTTFTNDEIPKEKNSYACIVVVDIDSVLRIDKKAYSQAYLEQCKCKLKKRRPANVIDADTEISDENDNGND